MLSVRNDFQDRVLEINSYFDFLSPLDNNINIRLEFTSPLGGSESHLIDNQLVKILKANAFLLLYNLVESTVLKSVQAIFNTIVDDSLAYKDLSDKFKNLWINSKSLFIKGSDTSNLNKIKEAMHNIAESILINEIAVIESGAVKITGNMDAKEIRIIAKQIGCMECQDGRHLVTIKNKRNHLAHGDFSFAEIGKDFSVQELTVFRNDAYDYLTRFMDIIEEFIQYRRFTSTPADILV